MHWAKNDRVRAVFVEEVKILKNKPLTQKRDFDVLGKFLGGAPTSTADFVRVLFVIMFVIVPSILDVPRGLPYGSWKL